MSSCSERMPRKNRARVAPLVKRGAAVGAGTAIRVRGSFFSTVSYKLAAIVDHEHDTEVLRYFFLSRS